MYKEIQDHMELDSSTLRLLFFCGHNSPWGYAHLEPLLLHPRIEIVALVLATEQRWDSFRLALSGDNYTGIANTTKLINKLKATLRPLRTKRSTRKIYRIAESYNVPVLSCGDVNSSTNLQLFSKLDADVVFSAAYPQIFKKPLLDLAPMGAANSHPSLLPRCRGAHPVFWAIASGESSSGITIHYMTEKLDQGDIISQIEVPLDQNSTYRYLYASLINPIPDLIDHFANVMFQSDFQPTPQNNSIATYFRNDRKIHRRIFWSKMTSECIDRLIRACAGQAYCWVNNKHVRVLEAETSSNNRNMTNSLVVPAGTVVDIVDHRPVVKARKGYVIIKSIKDSWGRAPKFEIGQLLL